MIDLATLDAKSSLKDDKLRVKSVASLIPNCSNLVIVAPSKSKALNISLITVLAFVIWESVPLFKSLTK